MMSNNESDDENVVVIPVADSLSDGDKNTWRLNDPQFKYRMIDDTRWRESLAEMWVQKTGAYEQGVSYILEKLPEGYGLFDRPRGTDPTARDSFLFGHPSTFYFQSRVAFFPHFYWLMTNSQGTCECHNCKRVAKGSAPRKRRTKAEMLAAKGEAAKRNPPRTLPAKFRRSLPELDPKYPRSEEEGPDYWRMHIMDLKEQGTLDREINHPFNMDWVTTHESLADYFVRLTLQASFIPRRGEVVLWTPTLDGTLEYNAQAKCVQVKGDDGKWHGMPDWRAGIVTQAPEEECNFMDIVQLTKKKNDLVTYSGFRVETLPDPLGDDKSYSLQYKYVPLKNIKPFGACEAFLYPLAREQFHPSIENALTTMASWSMLQYVRFKGVWPDAKLYCKGIWIGHEMLAIKDVVRLKPLGLTADMIEDKSNTTKDVNVTDVMVIEDIYLKLDGCIDDPKDPGYAKSYCPFIVGKVYTRDENRLDRPIGFDRDPLSELADHEVDTAFQCVGMQGYGKWYRVAGGKTCGVTKELILGRCYEPEATYLNFGSHHLDYDLHSILSGRRYSAQADARMPEGCPWFWGDYRVETLGLATMNGVEVGPAAEQRNMPRWHAILRFLNDCPRAGDKDLAFKDHVFKDDQKGKSQGAGRPTNATFAEIGKTSTLVSTGLGQFRGGDEDEEETSMEELNENVSEMELTEGELTAPIPFRGDSEESEGYADD